MSATGLRENNRSLPHLSKIRQAGETANLSPNWMYPAAAFAMRCIICSTDFPGEFSEMATKLAGLRLDSSRSHLRLRSYGYHPIPPAHMTPSSSTSTI